MTRHESMTAAEDTALNAAQVLFTANPVFLAPQMKHVLHAQVRILDEVGKFSTAWLQRRQEAAQTMIDAGRRIAMQGSVDPANALKEMVDWQTHSMERLAADAKDCSEMLNRCANALVATETRAKQENPDTMKQVAKSGASEPA
ncbi:hypothetical protein [Maliponia aquimaris]|uniref:Phasin protein n=1 Tax=Maliponia aquimaris TaxID=1673631 RepID=A0A238L3B5_9RHOB|nr:hypothetical protein [Maliponia aquimaris]SMX48826.1 hypothetical protein MAA8898_04124 [Maliponia aquimaris]